MAKLADRVKTLKVGDPMDKATRMGPVVSKAQMETVLAYIEAGKQEGARVVAGGGGRSVGNGQGLFRRAHDLRRRHQPDEDRPRGDLRARALRDSVPVDGRRASPRATRPPTGWPPRCGRATSAKALRAARAIRAGTVWVNAYNLFDAALPFGGFKESGFGRELGSVGPGPLHRGQDRLGRSLVGPVRTRRALRGTGRSPRPGGGAAGAPPRP